jgi:hypothetical protein
MAEELKKRTAVYVQRPREYEISGCPTCGNDDPDWSEYQGHLWCERCKVDFKPQSGGIFDGPIPINAAALMGIDLRMVEITTGRIIDPPTA